MANLRIKKEPAVKHPGHYGRQDLADALRAVGVKKGDILFTHVGLGMLGYAKEDAGIKAACAGLLDIFMDAIGSGGTLFVPTYSYSYCKNKIYDPLKTPSDVGEFTNYFLEVPNVKRSLDPIFSVAGIGPQAGDLFKALPRDCFGQDCLYDRLKRAGAKICNIGVGFCYATFIHHPEQICNVPYRFRKLFSGQTVYGKQLKEETWVYNVRILVPNSFPDLRRLENKAREQKLVKTSQVGLGEVTCIGCQDMWSLCLENIKKDPWFLAAGPAISNTIEKMEAGE